MATKTQEKALLDRQSIEQEVASNAEERERIESAIAEAIASGNVEDAGKAYTRLNELVARREFLDRLLTGVRDRDRRVEQEQSRRRLEELEALDAEIEKGQRAAEDRLVEAFLAFLQKEYQQFQAATQRTQAHNQEKAQLARKLPDRGNGGPIQFRGLGDLYLGRHVSVRDAAKALGEGSLWKLGDTLERPNTDWRPSRIRPGNVDARASHNRPGEV